MPEKGSSRIRVGVGGWTFAPWRGSFYPAGLPHAQELHHASRQLTAIEVNGTYYGTIKRDSFARWHDETPDDFMFALKAPRFATNRRELAAAGESIDRFVASGIGELRGKLGPILWQFMPTKVFDAGDFAAFLKLLPSSVEGQPPRHVLELRHASFMCDEFLDLARAHRVATVFADSPVHPSFADVTGDFVYARLMQSQAGIATGYAPDRLDAWADTARAWARGTTPPGAPLVQPAQIEREADAKPRDVFVFFIAGAKEKAPAAAGALIDRLGRTGP